MRVFAIIVLLLDGGLQRNGRIFLQEEINSTELNDPRNHKPTRKVVTAIWCAFVDRVSRCW
jgi:hypothetical protein